MIKKIFKAFFIITFLVLFNTNLYISSSAKSDTGVYRVIASNGLRIRENPINGNILTVMPSNSIINITNWDGEWAYVTYNNISGWCYSRYIIPSPHNSSIYYGDLEYYDTLKTTGYTSDRYGKYNMVYNGIRINSLAGTCVAVNTKQIPLGTKLYIEGIGYRMAMDTGANISSIDILCTDMSECYNIIGNRKVYIVRN